MQHAYSYTNLLSGLAATAFAWSDSSATNRGRLNNGDMSRLFACDASATSKSVVIDMGSATAVSCIAILNWNLGGRSPSVTIEAADNAAININNVTAKSASSPTASSHDPKSKDIALQFPSVTKRYWRISFSWTGSVALTIGELWFGVPTSLTRAMVYGDRSSEMLKMTEFESYSGEVRSTFIAGPIRQRMFSFQDMSESERNEVMAMWRLSRGGELLWIERVESTSSAASQAAMDCIYGRIQPAEFGYRQHDFGLYNPDELTIRSYGREVGN